MTRIVVIVLAVALLSACLGTTAFADSEYWRYQFAVGQGTNNWICMIGTQPEALDGVESKDTLRSLGPGTDYSALIMGSYLYGNYYRKEMRAPLLPGQSKTWNLDFAVGRYLASDPIYYTTLLFSPQQDYYPPSQWNITLTMTQVPAGYTGRTFWNLTGGQFGYFYDIPVHPYVGTIAKFDFTITAVPEPGSLLALSSGLLALGCIRLRRCK